tara:strand:- start:1042 stop:1380 length:339 start_codon:yes stop_codon:yes gene_type:complete
LKNGQQLIINFVHDADEASIKVQSDEMINGNPIVEGHFQQQTETSWIPSWLNVHDDYQRQGIASNTYHHINEMIGDAYLQPNDYREQSDEARAMWDKYGVGEDGYISWGSGF